MRQKRFLVLLVAMVLFGAWAFAGTAFAGHADVLDVNVQRAADGAYRFDVTVRYADSGWDHYADAFDVLAPNGDVLGARVLVHPHEAE